MTGETGQRAENREGRGRLSSIDLLPDEAEPDIVWALDQLRARSMHQKAILKEFNSRLADRGIKAISKSAWSRYAVRKAIQFRKLDDVHRLSGELVSNFDPESPDQVTVAVAELIKLAAFELLEDGKIGSKSLMEVSRALGAAVSAQKGSAEYRRQLQTEVDARLKKAADAVAEIGKKAGTSQETLDKITNLLTTGAA